MGIPKDDRAVDSPATDMEIFDSLLLSRKKRLPGGSLVWVISNYAQGFSVA